MRLLEGVNQGLTTSEQPMVESLKKSAAILKKDFGIDTFAHYTSFESGVLSGRRDTLRWLCGWGWHEWDDN